MVSASLFLLSSLAAVSRAATSQSGFISASGVISPQVMIIGFFTDEGEVWHGIPEFDVLAQNITVPGLSPLYPDVHCTSNGTICQMVAGEGEVNAGTSIAALMYSGLFDLSKTYHMIAGIAGINPEVAGVGSVTFARYVTQPDLQYEFDAREKPANYSTGYVPQGSQAPDQYPQSIYGTECFEVNDKLRSLAVGFAKTATLNDTDAAARFRATYQGDALYTAGTTAPAVYECDAATADTYVSGTLLSEAWQNYTTLITNGTGKYCTTLQEDSAVLEAIMRADLAGRADFSRTIVMRTGSDYDRQAPNMSAIDNLYFGTDGYPPALANIYRAGVKVVQGISSGWDATYQAGITPTNYVGDIFGSLGGTPDYGPGSIFPGGANSTAKAKKLRRRGPQLR